MNRDNLNKAVNLEHDLKTLESHRADLLSLLQNEISKTVHIRCDRNTYMIPYLTDTVTDVINEQIRSYDYRIAQLIQVMNEL